MISTSAAVEKARANLLKLMRPINERRLTSDNIRPMEAPGPDKYEPKTTTSQLSSEEVQFGAEESLGAIDTAEFTVPTLPKYEEKGKSRIGAKQQKTMLATGSGGRQKFALARYAEDSDVVEEKTPIDVPKPRFIWIYEWDLLEPYFTRNWTFTYHLPQAGFRAQMRHMTNEGKALGAWTPQLTNIPELPPPDKPK